MFTEVSPSAAKIQYPLISDRNHQISKSYRVLQEQSGTALRGTVIIDPVGMIMSKMVYPTEVGRNSFELLRLIQALQYNKVTGKVVPANWMPGQEGISISIQDIGRH